MKIFDTPLRGLWLLPQFEGWALLLKRRFRQGSTIEIWDWKDRKTYFDYFLPTVLSLMIKQLSNLNQSWKLPEWVDEGHYRLWIHIKGWPLLDIWAYIGWPPPNINCLEVIYSHEGWNQDAHHTQGGKRPREGGINGHSMELVCTHPNIGINVRWERGSSTSSTLWCQENC